MQSYPQFGTGASSGIEAHLVVSLEWISLQVHVLKRRDIHRELAYTRHKLHQSHNSTLHKHHEEEHGPTTDENKRENETTSILLSQAADLEPILDR